MKNFLLVGLGGALGAILRYAIGLIPVNERFSFPIKTFAINIIGCFIIGLIAAFSARQNGLNEKTVLLLKAGFCGAFTTFSTFALESESLIKSGKSGIALAYILLSVCVGILAVFAAEALAKNKFYLF